MAEKHRLRELTWPQVNAAARANKVVLLPIGCIEQHGFHLPLDVDNLIVEHLCEELARRRSDLMLVAPPIHYGFNVHNQGFPGCLNANIESMLAYVYDVAHSITASGFRKVLMVNGHGSNPNICRLAARKVVNSSDAHCAFVSWWDIVADHLRGHRDSVFPGGMAHACEIETSLYLHIRPEGVDMSKAVKEVQPPNMRHFWVDLAGCGPVDFVDDWSRLSETGVEGDPTTATAEKGRQAAELVIQRITEFCEDFRSHPIKPRRNFTIDGTPRGEPMGLPAPPITGPMRCAQMTGRTGNSRTGLVSIPASLIAVASQAQHLAVHPQRLGVRDEPLYRRIQSDAAGMFGPL